MKTEIIAIIDRSGSMGGIASDAIGGFNTFLKEQQAVPGEARLTTILFDHEQVTLHSAVPIESAPQLDNRTYVPRGSTALLDAIGTALNFHGQRIKNEGWTDKVIVCILTDGHENCSREFTADKIKEMVKHAEAHGWSFVYLAANQDAFATGAQYGIAAAHTMNFTANAAGTQTAYASMSNTVRSLRAQP